MSEESILDHGYIAEEHAPDPMISHGDPTPPGKVAIWMFLASEVMFFIGVLGSYIILRSGPAELGRWLEERRDVRADYRAIYGEEPSDPGAITLSIDSHDTHSRAESLIGSIRFSPS